ncbi:glycosyltransferase [Novosphingobium sp. KACC 22771]|uniref:glycosyltransferase n=1 Tax=Novosphingobium sp. KACC 22771 TaxID=3025670 RepID=UPI00236632A2|nr:glycosyltransferase [Novosphingobium sp. KACC 22771]WDF72751.1 glycosyltransferase [Novosphingobium sp. KACC 22771]
MPRAIAYDLTRLFLGPLSLSPRGIDRVDVALANHFFFNSKIESLGILPTPWGIRVFNADMVRRGLDHLHHIWAERIGEGEDPHWHGLVAALTGQGDISRPPPRRKPAGLITKTQRMWTHLRQTGIALGRSVGTLPHGAIYVNIGQIGLAVPVFHQWLANRRDITAAFMLHDTIPLEYPQFVSPSSVTHHARMVQTTLERADLVITTTRHASETIMATMARMGRSDMPIHVRGLPLPQALGMPRSADPALAGRHYFLTCSTIEPRKNHGLLIDVWRRIIARMGAAAPHLVIVGSPGRHAETILGEISGDPALARHIHHVSGLSSPALGRLTLGAAAMLCPSYAEGFGLSVLEANALGVPTIASDIASHREIANAQTRLLPPDDRHAWEDAIMDCGPGMLRTTPTIPEAMTEAAYCHDIAAFLDNFAQTKHKGAMQDFPLRHEKRP